MENKENLILGGMAIMAVWLLILTYNVFSKGADSNTLAAARALNTPAAVANGATTNPTNNQQAAIKPVNTTTQPLQPAVDPATAATISFEENSFDFGTIEEGDKVEHVFKFTNTSDNPLTISNARGSCGCTVPEWPREAIAPGEQGEIKVKFDSKGKKGKQSKTVTITANTDPANTMLTVISDVVALEGEE